MDSGLLGVATTLVDLQLFHLTRAAVLIKHSKASLLQHSHGLTSCWSEGAHASSSSCGSSEERTDVTDCKEQLAPQSVDS